MDFCDDYKVSALDLIRKGMDAIKNRTIGQQFGDGPDCSILQSRTGFV